jgi:hypothetical protein
VLRAAARKDWAASSKDANITEFVSDGMELLVEVTCSGYTVRAARLWDFSDKIVSNAVNGVPSQELTAADYDKAGRIENVLLGNARRF